MMIKISIPVFLGNFIWCFPSSRMGGHEDKTEHRFGGEEIHRINDRTKKPNMDTRCKCIDLFMSIFITFQDQKSCCKGIYLSVEN